MRATMPNRLPIAIWILCRGMDSIQLTGIRCYGYTGFLPEEKVLGQWFEVDLTLWLDLSAAGQSDRIEDTLDYRQTIAGVQELVKHADFALIERLAEAIADRVLQQDRVERVCTRVCKPAAPIPDFTGKIAVEVTRSRPKGD